MDIVIPNQRVLKEFSAIAQNLYEEQLLVRKQSENLKMIRDVLLPKLMSGELDVSDLNICKINFRKD